MFLIPNLTQGLRVQFIDLLFSFRFFYETFYKLLQFPPLTNGWVLFLSPYVAVAASVNIDRATVVSPQGEKTLKSL